MSVYFIRHGKLDLPYKSHADMPFDLICKLASGEEDPPCDQDFLNENLERLQQEISFDSVKTIIAGPSVRTQSVAKFLQRFIDVPILSSDDAREIDFNLREMMEYHADGSDPESIPLKVVNVLVPKSLFIEDCSFSESIAALTSRFYRLKDLIKKHQDSGDVLVVTNGFYMRAIQAVIETNGSPTEQIAIDAYDPGYLEGYVLDDSLSQIVKRI